MTRVEIRYELAEELVTVVVWDSIGAVSWAVL